MFLFFSDALSHDVEATSTLLIGNLNVSTNEKCLHQVFAGALSVHIPQDKTGVSKGSVTLFLQSVNNSFIYSHLQVDELIRKVPF